MIIKVYANDGREFQGSNFESLAKECNAYEAGIALKKVKEEAERKALEEKERKLKEYKKSTIKEINDHLLKANGKMKEYSKEFGQCLVLSYIGETLSVYDMLEEVVCELENYYKRK